MVCEFKRLRCLASIAVAKEDLGVGHPLTKNISKNAQAGLKSLAKRRHRKMPSQANLPKRLV